MICGHFIIAAVRDDGGWSVFDADRNILAWRQVTVWAASSRGKWYTRSSQRAPSCCCVLQQGKVSGLVFAELKCPPPTQTLDLIPFGALVLPSMSPGPINEVSPSCLSRTPSCKTDVGAGF